MITYNVHFTNSAKEYINSYIRKNNIEYFKFPKNVIINNNNNNNNNIIFSDQSIIYSYGNFNEDKLCEEIELDVNAYIYSYTSKVLVITRSTNNSHFVLENKYVDSMAKTFFYENIERDNIQTDIFVKPILSKSIVDLINENNYSLFPIELTFGLSKENKLFLEKLKDLIG